MDGKPAGGEQKRHLPQHIVLIRYLQVDGLSGEQRPEQRHLDGIVAEFAQEKQRFVHIAKSHDRVAFIQDLIFQEIPAQGPSHGFVLPQMME